MYKILTLILNHIIWKYCSWYSTSGESGYISTPYEFRDLHKSQVLVQRSQKRFLKHQTVGASQPSKKKKLLECPWISVERLIWPKTTSKDSGTCTIDRFQKWRDETTRLLGWFNLWRGSSNTLIQTNNLPLHFQNVYFKEGPTENYPKTATFQVLCYIFHIFF